MSARRMGRIQDAGLRKQQGFTLFEVLIAVVVLSVGLLGLASLQATSLRHNQNSLARSQISILSYDMMDRMRANMPAVLAGSYNQLDASNLPAATNANCTTTTGCNAAAMALQDHFEWNQRIQSVLPGGQGVVCRDNSPDDGANATNPGCNNAATDPFVVKIWWDENRDGSLDEDLDGTLNDPFIVVFTP